MVSAYSDDTSSFPLGPMVRSAWLARRLDDPKLRLLDASWYLPSEGKVGHEAFTRAHMPGATFFDIDEVADQTTDLPHMLPSPQQFVEQVGAAGIGPDSFVVVYDQTGVRSSARVWWSLRAMGHGQVFVLDGGFPAWIENGGPVETRQHVPNAQTFSACLQGDLVATIDDVRRAVADGGPQIVDARPSDRFKGLAAEPRPGLRSGHMPGALNVPYGELICPDGRLKDQEALQALFMSRGVDLSAPLLTTCGSGVTASVLALALARVGRWDAAVYDGSWAEWGAIPGCPVVTSP